MGQSNSKRIVFKARQAITSALNDARQEMAFTGYFQLGDTVDVVELDAQGCVLSVLSDNNSVAAIENDVAVVLSTPVDTSTPPNGGTYHLVCQPIDDAQEAIDRLYRRKVDGGDVNCEQVLPIVAQVLNSPSVGQTRYEVNDVKALAVGDTVKILDVGAGGGLLGEATVLAVNIYADESNNRSEIVIDDAIDTTSATSPVIQSQDVTIQDCVERAMSRIDSIDDPIENEDMDVGNALDTAFETDALFLANSSKVMVDGVRKKKGTAGTRASLVQGAGNAQLTLTSMLLGLLGNEVRVQVQAGAGFTVAVTKSFNASSSAIIPGSTDYLIQVNDNGGLATAEEIADAINADAEAKRIVQAQFGGDGTGVVAAFGPTALAGGLDNGTGDYAELPQVFENVITATGYKWVSFHIRPNEPNRMNRPPEDDEELTIDYRQALVNA